MGWLPPSVLHWPRYEGREATVRAEGRAVLLGFLGCERSAERFHLPAIARLTNARLTAAYDARPEQRQRIARMAPGCRNFDTPEALLAARVVDAVIVASPQDSQASLAVMALGAGVPVLIEPPLAASL